MSFQFALKDCNRTQTALDVPWAGKCAGENNGSTIDSIVLAKVAQGRSSPRTTKNADWDRTSSTYDDFIADFIVFGEYKI